MVKICCITYKRLTKLVEEALKRFQDEELNVTVAEGLRNEILEGKNRELIQEAEVILAGGANAVIARDTFSQPVLEFKITEWDYMTAVEKGFRAGSRPAIVTYQEKLADHIMQFYETQNKQIENIVYEDTEELCEKIRNSPCDVIIGAAHAVEMGARMDKQTVLIYPGYTSIIDSLKAAKSVAMELRKERRKNQYFQAMFESGINGFLLLDREFHVIDYNKRASDLFENEADELKNMDFSRLFPELDLKDFAKRRPAEESGTVRREKKELYYRIVKMENRDSAFEGAVVELAETAEIKEHLRAAEREKRRQEEKGFRAKRNFVDIIGSSPATKQCISEAKIFAKSEANVMIYGETGVGKEIFAQSIHNRSFRKDGPFIAINCAAIPDNLLEAELFGYDEGAFTGGRKGGKKGLFELADGGTLFLDEIGDISPALQSRLLRVLQEREVMHIGGERMIPIDVRVIAATNRDLEHYTNEEFRRDLLYRLNVLELKIPPLRERSSDAAELFEFYFKIKRGISIYYVELTEGVREIMQLYSWPGNIRELQNCCERFVLYLEQAGKVSSLYMKKSMVKAIGEERLRNDILNMYGYDGKNATPELVEQLKKVFSYNREQIAAVLGISRTTMWRITAKKV